MGSGSAAGDSVNASSADTVKPDTDGAPYPDVDYLIQPVLGVDGRGGLYLGARVEPGVTRLQFYVRDEEAVGEEISLWLSRYKLERGLVERSVASGSGDSPSEQRAAGDSPSEQGAPLDGDSPSELSAPLAAPLAAFQFSCEFRGRNIYSAPGTPSLSSHTSRPHTSRLSPLPSRPLNPFHTRFVHADQDSVAVREALGQALPTGGFFSSGGELGPLGIKGIGELPEEAPTFLHRFTTCLALVYDTGMGPEAEPEGQQ